MRITVINGPNLDRLGSREPERYGTQTLAELEVAIGGWGDRLGVEVEHVQSNHEGELIEAIHRAAGVDGIVINPGALTHTSRGIPDALLATGVPAVEVHISNVMDREPWRASSTLEGVVVRRVYGRGASGYRDAMRHLVNRTEPFEPIRYGPHQDNVADLRGDSTAASKLIVLIHGGFWMSHWERDITETLAVDLARRGFLTLNIEYRRFGDGGGWPGSAHDVKMAIDCATGLWNGEIVLIGHSAGGYMALWAARRTNMASVIGLAAVTDLKALLDGGGPGSRSARSLLDGGAPERVGPAPSTLLVHGVDDDQVEVEQSSRLAGDVELELHDGLSHFHMLDPTRAHWQGVVRHLS